MLEKNFFKKLFGIASKNQKLEGALEEIEEANKILRSMGLDPNSDVEPEFTDKGAERDFLNAKARKRSAKEYIEEQIKKE